MASSDFSKFMFHGNLTADPVMRDGNGVPCCTFDVANNTSRKDDAGNFIPVYYRVTAWRQQATLCSTWLHKGDRVQVIGELIPRTYTDKNGTPRTALNVTADFSGGITFLRLRSANPAQKAPQANNTYNAATAATPNATGFAQVTADDDELPF